VVIINSCKETECFAKAKNIETKNCNYCGTRAKNIQAAKSKYFGRKNTTNYKEG